MPPKRGKQGSIRGALLLDGKRCNIYQVLTLAWIATTADEPSDYIATKIFADAWDQFDAVVMMEDGKYQTRPRNDEVQAAIQE